MKILTRYVFKEMLGPTVLGFGFYTFIILMKNLFDVAGMIIRRSLPASTVGRLLFLSLPHIVVLTVPMSLLFGILIAIGRLSSDSEIIAMRASGVSARTIYRPVFLFSFIIFLINLYLMNVVLPRGNTELNSLQAEIYTSGIERELRPRVFYDEYENLMIYVNDVDPRNGQWKGVFVADSRLDDTKDSPPLTTPQAVRESRADDSVVSLGARGGQRIVAAQSGNLSIVEPGKQIWLNLRKAESHVWDPRKSDRYDLNRNDLQRMRLPGRDFSGSGIDPSLRYIRSFREMNLRELVEQARMLRNTPDREAYWAAKVQIHKMFVFPFACLVFGVLGLPLGVTNRRGGKSSGFSLSIAIILVYYVMINNGEHLAVTGKLSPAFAMWMPNIILLAVGFWLMNRVNRDAGAQRSDTGLWRRLLLKIPSRKRQAVAALTAQNVTEEPMLKRLDITFPNILDRYILREFLKVLGLVLISTAALFVIVDYTDLSGDIRANHIPFHTVFAYYRFTIFQILNWTVPISVLVATLVTFGLLSKSNEVTAFKSSGMSLFRVSLPVLAIAVVISGLAYLMLDYVLPYSNQRVDQLRNRIKGKKAVAAQNQQKLWFLGKGRYIINFLSYDRNARQLSQVQVFEFHPAEFRITRRVYADRARWDGEGWVFEHGWMRSFGDNNTSTLSPIVRPLRLFYSERPEDFATEVKSPDQMTFAQLRRYIETIKRSGYAAEELTVKLYQKTSWPFISLVMALIALPFAFRIGKRGALYGVGIALVLGIFYWMIFAVFTKFGEVGNLPPALAAWSANILFAIAALYMFLRVET